MPRDGVMEQHIAFLNACADIMNDERGAFEADAPPPTLWMTSGVPSRLMRSETMPICGGPPRPVPASSRHATISPGK